MFVLFRLKLIYAKIDYGIEKYQKEKLLHFMSSYVRCENQANTPQSLLSNGRLNFVQK